MVGTWEGIRSCWRSGLELLENARDDGDLERFSEI